jgi:Protein of unknown function (DUF1186)
MSDRPYSEILQQLEILEDPYEIEKHDLLALGITTVHIPDLIDTILDDRYYLDEDSASLAHLFAYIALGQLKTDAAIDGLLLGVNKWASSDWFEWFTEAMPEIFANIGVSAIPALIGLLQDSNQHMEARFSAISYLEDIYKKYPEVRDRCVEAISQELQKFADNNPEFNGYLVGSLAVEFKAVETAPLIEAAFAADRVDPSFVGGWDNVRVYLGLKKAPKIPTQRREIQRKLMNNITRDLDRESEILDNKIRHDAGKGKTKRKQQQAARRKNRKK